MSMFGHLTPVVDDTEIKTRGGEADAFPTVYLSVTQRESRCSTFMEPKKIGRLMRSYQQIVE